MNLHVREVTQPGPATSSSYLFEFHTGVKISLSLSLFSLKVATHLHLPTYPLLYSYLYMCVFNTNTLSLSLTPDGSTPPQQFYFLHFLRPLHHLHDHGDNTNSCVLILPLSLDHPLSQSLSSCLDSGRVTHGLTLRGSFSYPLD